MCMYASVHVKRKMLKENCVLRTEVYKVHYLHKNETTDSISFVEIREICESNFSLLE